MQNNIGQFEGIDAELHHFNELYNTNSLIADKYFAVPEFKNQSQIWNWDNAVSVIHWNIRSLLPKLDEISSELDSLSGNFDLICFCETWLTINTIEQASLNNYATFHSYRDSRFPGGGVSIFAKTHLKPKVLSKFQISLPYFESVGIEFTKNQKKYLVCEIYRPPRSSPSDFLEKLESIFNNFHSAQYEEVFICGDYNFNLLDSDSNNSICQFVNK